MTPTQYIGTTGEYGAFRGSYSCTVIRRADGWHGTAWHCAGTGSEVAGAGQRFDSGPKRTRAEAADAAFNWLIEREREVVR